MKKFLRVLEVLVEGYNIIVDRCNELDKRVILQKLDTDKEQELKNLLYNLHRDTFYTGVIVGAGTVVITIVLLLHFVK